MAANPVQSIINNKVETSTNDAPSTTVPDTVNTTDTKVPASDTSAPPVAPAVDADTGKTAEASLAPAPVTQTPTATNAAEEVASVPVAESANEEPPSIAKGDLSSKVDAADTLAEQPEKQTDQIPTPVSQPPATEPITSEAGAGAGAPGAEPKLLPKPVSVEEVSDKGTPIANPPATAATIAIQPDSAAETTAPKTTSVAEPEKSEPETGDKRKVDKVSNGSADTPNGIAGHDDHDDEPAGKKQKSNGASTNGTAPNKKPGRPKKEKKAPAPVGRTVRKTRSQGAADIQ
ncbi:hypothetical protein MGN70_013827 [Eutypa lata]|nr:hypothetical protein MGN70_013827 [Eutypa lata]